jgi:purine-binding chemotaxis protein CheW
MEKTDLKIAGKCLTFRVGPEEYGVEILKVREIVGLQKITEVPMTTSHIRGVINLRGKIIPVVDMRHKLKLPPQAQSRENCIVIVMVRGPQGESLVGLLVDAMNEVFGMEEAALEPIPQLGEGKALEFIHGLARVRNRVVILLNVDQVVQAEELEGLEQLSRATALAGGKKGN